MEEENKIEQKVEQKPLSKREKKRLAKQEKKQRKKEQKLADKEFERNHPLRKRRRAAWIVELVGLGVTAVPGVLIIGLSIAAVAAYILGALIYLFLIFGLLIFGLGYLIYYFSVEHATIDGYFSPGSTVVGWGADLMRFVNGLDGWFLTIFGGVSLVINIVGFVLLLTSLSACSKKHKVAYIILMVLIILVSAGILAFGLTKVISSGTPTPPPPTE